MNLKRIIKEEMEDEWNWAQDKPNIWFSYQMLLFDEVPTKEDVKKFIMDAFSSGLVSQESIDAWIEGIDRDVRGIVKDAENNLKPYIRISLDDEWFYMGIEYDLILDRYKDLRSIKYSEAKNYLINENDLGWIMDLDPREVNFRIGDVIKVHNVGNEQSFLKWLGDYSDDYLNGRLGEFITGEIVNITEDRLEIQELNTGEYIFFPQYHDFEYLRDRGGWDVSNYRGLDMYYEILEDEN